VGPGQSIPDGKKKKFGGKKLGLSQGRWRGGREPRKVMVKNGKRNRKKKKAEKTGGKVWKKI